MLTFVKLFCNPYINNIICDLLQLISNCYLHLVYVSCSLSPKSLYFIHSPWFHFPSVLPWETSVQWRSEQNKPWATTQKTSLLNIAWAIRLNIQLKVGRHQRLPSPFIALEPTHSSSMVPGVAEWLLHLFPQCKEPEIIPLKKHTRETMSKFSNQPSVKNTRFGYIYVISKCTRYTLIGPCNIKCHLHWSFHRLCSNIQYKLMQQNIPCNFKFTKHASLPLQLEPVYKQVPPSHTS
jgi:hypothetical protein